MRTRCCLLLLLLLLGGSRLGAAQTPTVTGTAPIHVSWTAPPPATIYQGYVLERADARTSPYRELARVGKVTQYDDLTAEAGFAYCYRISLSAGGLQGPAGTPGCVSAMPTRLTLTWDAPAPRPATFQVESSRDQQATWQVLGSVPGTQTTTLLPAGDIDRVMAYRVTAIDGAARSDPSKALAVPIGGCMGWADSEETAKEDGRASNAQVGYTGKIWHTAWSTSPVPPQPHWYRMQLPVKDPIGLLALLYTPRQDSGSNGTITKYEVYVSLDGTAWGLPVAQGDWAADKTTKTVLFSAPQPAKFVQLRSLANVGNYPFTSAERIQVVYRSAGGPAEGCVVGLNMPEVQGVQAQW